MRRSFSGPLLLLAIGALFLWRNLHPEAPIFDLVAQYWPFALIAWGLLRLIEGLIWHREGVRGSFTGGEIVLIILICIAGSGIWQAREHGVRFMRGGPGFLGAAVRFPGVGDEPGGGHEAHRLRESARQHQGHRRRFARR